MRSAPPSTPESLYDSSSGSVTRNDEKQSSGLGDPGIEMTADVIGMVAATEDILDQLCGRLPRILPICTDFITVLRQAVPQELAQMQSLSPMSAAGSPGNTMNQFSGLSGIFGGGGPMKPQPIAGPAPLGPPPAAGAGGVTMG